MSNRLAISCEVDPALHEALTDLAARWDVDLDHVVTTAMMRLVDDETPLDQDIANLPVPPPPPGLEILDDAAVALRRFVQEGIDSADRGELIDHDQVMSELAILDRAALEAKKKHAA